jgi:lysophospholipase L1-like esterase
MSARRAALALVVFVAAGLALAWIDVLPGGWTLRGWVTPHAVRHAREHAAHRARRLAAFEAERAGAPEGAVVFLGSSTIERFPLAERFPGVPCLDRGIGEESLPALLDRLERSLPAAAPAGAVLYLGSIDFRVEGRATARIAALAELALRFLREGRPDLPLAVIGILPERDMPPAMVERLAATNASLAALCERAGVAFVRTDRPPVTGPDGSLVPASAADRLHLNGAGYRALARWLVEDGGAVGRLLAGPGGG